MCYCLSLGATERWEEFLGKLKSETKQDPRIKGESKYARKLRLAHEQRQFLATPAPVAPPRPSNEMMGKVFVFKRKGVLARSTTGDEIYIPESIFGDHLITVGKIVTCRVEPQPGYGPRATQIISVQ